MVYDPKARTVQPTLQAHSLWSHERYFTFIVSVSPFLSSLFLPRLYRQETLWNRDCIILCICIIGQHTTLY